MLMSVETPDTGNILIQSLYDTLECEKEEKYRPLGDTFLESIHKITTSELSSDIAKQLNNQLYNSKLEVDVHFVTIRPSPEHMYNIFKRVPSYDEQMEWFSRNILDESILSVSVEKGHKNTQLLHYHLIILKKKKQYNKWKKLATNLSTCLHKIYGYQKSVLESEKTGKLITGLRYFLGISKNVKKLMKSDHFKLILNKKLFKNLFS
jgi:hypothetical protein